jgi:MYXO-CTERM domain-containing protein
MKLTLGLCEFMFTSRSTSLVRGLGLGLGAVMTLCATSALASPEEYFTNTTLHPRDPKKIALGYQSGFSGLMVSNDGGKTFRTRPSESVRREGISGFPRIFSLLYSGDALLLGGEQGLLLGDEESCKLTHASVTPDNIVSGLTLHPTDPDVVFFATSKGTTGRAGLFRRPKSGEPQLLGPEDASNLTIQSLSVVTRAASVEQLRFVEFFQSAESAEGRVRYSDDLGASWTEHVVSANQGSNAKLFAVDPVDPDVFFVAINKFANDGTEPLDEFLISKDAGKSFAPYLVGAGIADASDITLAPDGRFWIGDRAGGLHQGTRLGQPTSKVADVPVTTLVFDKSQDAVLVTHLIELGRFDPKDKSYCQMFLMHETTGFPNCAGETLRSDRLVTEQMCTHFCNGSHYWYAPLCSQMYDDASAVCGLGVLQTPYRDKLPSAVASAPRCKGFESTFMLPPGVAAADAGAPDAGVGVADASTDAGAAPAEAGVSTPGNEDAGEQDAANEDEDAADGSEPNKRAKDGCGCRVGAATSADATWKSLIGLGTLAALGWRRRRRA